MPIHDSKDMRGKTWQRSIAFQLWVRLSLALVAFTLVVYPAYLWIETADNIAEAEEEAAIRATVAAGALHASSNAERPAANGNSPANRPPQQTPVEEAASVELEIMETFGLLAIERLHPEGHVLESWGEVSSPPQPAGPVHAQSPKNGLTGWTVSVSGGTYEQADASPLGLLRGESYAYVYVVATGPVADGFTSHRIVVDAGHLRGEAYTLLFRSLVFGGSLLLLSLVTLWGLLSYFVTRPMREYSTTARRIAAGEPLRMPENRDNDIGELGVAINTMADALRLQATVDSLTGLFNLRHLRENLPEMLERARESGSPLCLANFDVNDLKPVNDEHGHAAGDSLLIAVAQALTEWAGPDAICWRVGGDEFVVASPGMSVREASGRRDDLEASLARRPLDLEGRTLIPSVALGFAAFPADGRNVTQLMAVADARMYDQKAANRAA